MGIGDWGLAKQKYAIKIYTKESLLDPQKRNTVKNEIYNKDRKSVV